MRFFYSILFYILLPLIVLRLLWRSLRAPLYRCRLSERFGFFPTQQIPVNASVIWVHTVSVGETISAKPVIIELLNKYPSHHIVITTTTPTGSEQVHKIFASDLSSGGISHSYIPYDLPGCVERFLISIKPKIAIFMETEVWPNIIAACKKRHIPSVLINGRLSGKSLKGYQRFLSLSQHTFSSFYAVVAQTKEDASRFSRLSAVNVVVSGSLKSEIMVSEGIRQQARVLKQEWSLAGARKIIIAASTHYGEDELVLSAFKQLLQKDHDLLLVLVPRHLERFGEVKRLCHAQGYVVASRSSQDRVDETTQIIVGDTMGELMLLYGASDIAIVGGSFVENGGHNMLEPAVWGLPVISGRSVYNFSKIVDDMQEKNALLLVANEVSLVEGLSQWLAGDQLFDGMGVRAKDYVLASRGALLKTLDVIDDALRKS